MENLTRPFWLTAMLRTNWIWVYLGTIFVVYAVAIYLTMKYKLYEIAELNIADFYPLNDLTINAVRVSNLQKQIWTDY